MRRPKPRSPIMTWTGRGSWARPPIKGQRLFGEKRHIDSHGDWSDILRTSCSQKKAAECNATYSRCKQPHRTVMTGNRPTLGNHPVHDLYGTSPWKSFTVAGCVVIRLLIHYITGIIHVQSLPPAHHVKRHGWVAQLGSTSSLCWSHLDPASKGVAARWTHLFLCRPIQQLDPRHSVAFSPATA